MMAQQDIVGGLFGITPEGYQQQQDMAQQAQALRFAQLAPAEQTQYSLFRGGQQLGSGLTGLMGVEDPQMQLISRTNQLVQEIGIDTPEKLTTLAGELQKLPGGAQLAAQALAERDKRLVSAATVKQKSRENIPTPQTLAESSKLASLQAKYPDTLEGRAQAADEFAEWKSSFKQKEAKAGAPVAEQQDKALRDARVKKLLDYEDRAGSASQTLQLVQDFNSVLDRAFTGTASGAKLTAGQVANALGVTVTGTTESEQLDQLFAALTVGQAKNLKGALSDKDVKFLKEAVGSRGLTKDTLVAVINRIAREAEVDKSVYSKASGFKGDLAQFDFAKAQDESRKEINEKLAKQQRLNELRNKQGQPGR
jgi:hypothetical protein